MSVEFDPVSIGRQRRRIDPVVLVVVAILAGLALAILKPWEPAPDRPNAIAVASPVAASAAGRPAPESPATATTRPASTEPDSIALGWGDIEQSASRSPSFAVDVVTVDWTASTGSAGYPVFVEDWHLPASEGETVLDTRGRSIVGLGVTTEPGSLAEDVRIWRKRAGGELEWVDANPIEDTVVGGPLVLAIPGQAIAFPAGEYRVDALVEGTIRRVDVAIPGPAGRIPPLTDPPYPTIAGLVPLTSSDPSEVLSGPFVTVGGRARPLAVAPVDPLDETGAWIDSLTTPDSADRPTVARVYQPRATGIGVMLTSHARIERAEIVRLAPDVPLGPVTTIGGVSYNHGGTPWIGFAAPALGAWPPGDYALTVSWVDGTERRTDTWHIELRPGPSIPSAPAPG